MEALKIQNPNGEFLTYRQTAERCNLSVELTRKLAKEAEAVISISQRVKRVDIKKFDKYLREHYALKD